MNSAAGGGKALRAPLPTMKLLLPGLILLLAWAALAGARLRWEAATRHIRDRLSAAGRGTPTARGGQDWSALPLPVQRYLRRALPRHVPAVAAVRIRHEGSFNLAASGERWLPFSSSELVVLDRPGFDWDARIRLAPGLAIHVRDGYAEGEGFTEARLLALWPLALARGRGDIAAGQLMRFLAETPWYPTALLPGAGIRWTAVDDRHALATLEDGGTAASLLFTFGEDDFVLAVRAEARPRAAGGRTVPTPWQGRFSRYAERQGFWVPLEGEVSWILPEGPHPYWRGRITSIEFQEKR